jgi:hypothetical protein
MNKIKNKKILLVGCYGYADGYLAGGKAITELGHYVGFFPLYDFQNQKGNIQDIINILNGVDNLGKSYINYKNDTPTEPFDLCIWWHNSTILSINQWNKIKSKTLCKFIQLDWDAGACDKSKQIHWTNAYKNKLIGLKIFDSIYACNANIIKMLRDSKENTSCYIDHFNPGYHPSTSFYDLDDKYKCDVSIICTNLYEDMNLWENTKICRKSLVDEIYKRNDINFHLYGPEQFKKQYPKAYKGFIKYDDCYKVFSNSKINLNISPVGNILNGIVDGKMCSYMSERAPQILACKGLMACDTELSPLLIHEEDYIRVDDIPNFMKKLDDIINNSEKYDLIRGNGFKKGDEFLKWKNTFEKIIDCL